MRGQMQSHDGDGDARGCNNAIAGCAELTALVPHKRIVMLCCVTASGAEVSETGETGSTVLQWVGQ